MLPVSAVDPLRDLIIFTMVVGFGFWVLVFGIDSAAEISKHAYTEEEFRKLRRDSFINWWIVSALSMFGGVDAALRLLDALGR